MRFTKREFDRLSVVAQANDAENKQARKVTRTVVADIGQALQSLTPLPSDLIPPAWIGGSDGPWPAHEVFVAKNGLVHLPSIETGKDFMRPLTPCFFTTMGLSYDFIKDAPRPVAWLTFLGQLWRDDPQSIGTLQEWIGYLLTLNTRQQKILALIGPPRSGKGTITRIIGSLIGPENVASPSASSFATNFGLSALLGKSLAIIQDARFGVRDTATVVERLLSISGEDVLTIDRKYLPPVTCKLDTRLMIVSNELPRLPDASGALAGRMIVLRLTRSFLGEEDTGLTDKLLAELPGILLWAIEGWKRLRSRGHFVQPATGRELLTELEDLSSPVKAFVNECCVTGPEQSISRSALYDAYKEWAQAKGNAHTMSPDTFGRDLRAVLPGMGSRQRTINGKKERWHVGIALAPTDAAKPEPRR